MRLIRLLLLGALGAYLYKKFAKDPHAGEAETQAAEPFSTEELGGDAAPAAESPETEPQKDTLERPTWLQPADADESAATAGDGG